MRRAILALIGIVLLSAASMQAQTKQYVLNIGDFTEFTVADNINVDYKYMPDSAGYASFACEPKYTHAITFINNKGKIKIVVISDEPITGKLPTLTIYSSGLTKVTNLSDSTVCLLNTNPCEKLSLKVMGNGIIKAFDVYTTKLTAAVEAGSGHIYLQGKTQEANYTIAGAGVIEGGALEAQKVKSWMLGTGAIDCTVENTLSIYGAGSGTIYYKGNPDIKKRNLGIKLVQINSDK